MWSIIQRTASTATFLKKNKTITCNKNVYFTIRSITLHVKLAADVFSTYRIWPLVLHCHKKHCLKMFQINCKHFNRLGMANSPATHIHPTSESKAWHLFPLQRVGSQFVHISGMEIGLIPGRGTGPRLHTEKCSLLYEMLPASTSVVNTASVVYGYVSHLFVVLLGVRPQVEVDDCRGDAAGFPVSLLHQLAKTLFDELDGPDRTTSNLDLSPVPWTQQLAWEKLETNA